MTEACDFAEMSAPTDAHAKLEAFAGTFRAEVKMWMGPGDPMVSTGTMTNEMVLDGRFLQHTYVGDHQEGSPFPNFRGHGYWGFNKQSGKYEGVWIDTAATMMQTETGDVDETGTVWTMTSSMACPQSGAPMAKRSVVTKHDDDHHTMEMFFTGEDGNEHKAMQIDYTRA